MRVLYLFEGSLICTDVFSVFWSDKYDCLFINLFDDEYIRSYSFSKIEAEMKIRDLLRYGYVDLSGFLFTSFSYS